MNINLSGNHATLTAYIDSEYLDPGRSQVVRNHSPDGFNWGYSGSGPAQLALAICLHLFNDKEQALTAYQDFMSKVVAALPQKDFDAVINMETFEIVKLNGIKQ